MSESEYTQNQITLEARNASLSDLAALLKVQHDAKLDAVVPASAIHSYGGTLWVDGLGPDGPAGGPGIFRPTTVCDDGFAEKLSIPRQYLRRMRDTRPDLLDANINGWLHGMTPHVRFIQEELVTEYPPFGAPDSRKFLLRCFNNTDWGGEGVARALLSDSYRIIDNFDVLTAALDGVRATGLNVEVTSCNLSERRMTVNIEAPQIRALAPKLLRNYRSPFSGATDSDGVIFAGLVISNSETGGSAFTIVPRIVVLVCKNGATMTKDALRSVHLGGKLDEGVIEWSHDTRQRNVELVAAQTRDAVAAFLNEDYLAKVVARLDEKADTPLENPAKAVELVGAQLHYSQQQIDGILDHFIRGGQVTAGGVFQAVTSYAQTVDTADEAWDLEASAVDALRVAATL